MANIQAYGLSSSQSSALARAILSHSGSASSASVSTALAKGYIATKVSSAVAINSTKIRVTFNRQMTSNSDLTDLSNYTITSTGKGVTPYKKSAEAEDTLYPHYVDITVSEMTNGQPYSISVGTGIGGPIDRYGVRISSANNSSSFTGVGILPTIDHVEATSATTVKVVFSEAMEDNRAIRNKDNYSFDNGLIVTAVTNVDSDTVYLTTSTQVAGLLYTLTIG